jgi:hypothetical protein
MKYVFAFLAVCFSVYSSSQTTESKFEIGVQGSVDYSFRSIRNAEQSISSDLWFEVRNSDEDYMIGWTSGISIALNLSDRMKLRGGVSMSSQGYTRDYHGLMDPRNPFLAPALEHEDPTELLVKHEYKAVEVPLNVVFQFGERAFRPFLSAGMIYGHVISDDTRLIVSYESDPDTRHTGDSQYSTASSLFYATLGVGGSYSFTERITTSLELNGAYSLNEFDELSVATRLWRGGLNLGLTYDL